MQSLYSIKKHRDGAIALQAVDPARIDQNGCEKSIRLCELLLLASTSTPTLGLAVQAEISNRIIAYRKNLDMTLFHYIGIDSTNLSGWRNIYHAFKIKRLVFTDQPHLIGSGKRDSTRDVSLYRNQKTGAFKSIRQTDYRTSLSASQSLSILSRVNPATLIRPESTI